MDQSPPAGLLVANYGGSDSTQPDFNRSRYVRFFSTHEPQDLGQITGGVMVLDGLIGAQSGTQTLFLKFYAPRPARIGLRRVPLNPYTDQYVSLSLRGVDGNSIAVQPEAPSIQQADVAPAVDGAVDIDSLVAGAGGERPEGVYTVTVSSSQWPPLPFRLQILARSSEELSGVAAFEVDSAGRLGLFDLDVSADFQVEASGCTARLYTLGANQLISYAFDQYWVDGYGVNDGSAGSEPDPQVADFTITPTALVQRLSPLQGLFF